MIEWFKEQLNGEGEPQVICFLKKMKGDRDKHDTYAYRTDALENVRRILKRKAAKTRAMLKK